MYLRLNPEGGVTPLWVTSTLLGRISLGLPRGSPLRGRPPSMEDLFGPTCATLNNVGDPLYVEDLFGLPL